MWKPELFEVSSLKDGSLVLSCGDEGMETDLIFASGCMAGDPKLQNQRELLEFIVAAVKDKRRP